MNDKKIALITGANKGIGLETARQLGQIGYTVLIGARDEKRGKEAETTLRGENLDARFVHLDVDDAATHERAAKFVADTFGKLDVLINNAAISIDGGEITKPQTASETTLETYRKTFDTNFFGTIAVTQAFLPLIKKSDAGRIVNLSSILGSLTMNSDANGEFYHFKVPAYGTSKTALNAFTVQLAYELRDTKIKVNAAHPGYVKTDMGGAGAFLEVAEGAKTSVALATLPPDAPSGKFVYMGKNVPW